MLVCKNELEILRIIGNSRTSFDLTPIGHEQTKFVNRLWTGEPTDFLGRVRLLHVFIAYTTYKNQSNQSNPR